MFGDRLKYLRKKNKLYGKDLAKIINVSGATLSDYENNKIRPSFEILFDIADRFDVSLDWLLRGKELPDLTNDPCIQKYMKLNERGKLKAEVYVDLLLNEQDNQSGDRDMRELKKSQALKNTS